MMPNPSRSSSSVIVSGGFVKNVFHRTNVYSPSLAEDSAEPLHRVGRPVERGERLHRGAILDELHDSEQPNRPHGPDHLVFGLQIGQQLLHHDAHPAGILDR